MENELVRRDYKKPLHWAHGAMKKFADYAYFLQLCRHDQLLPFRKETCLDACDNCRYSYRLHEDRATFVCRTIVAMFKSPAMEDGAVGFVSVVKTLLGISALPNAENIQQFGMLETYSFQEVESAMRMLLAYNVLSARPTTTPEADGRQSWDEASLWIFVRIHATLANID